MFYFSYSRKGIGFFYIKEREIMKLGKQGLELLKKFEGCELSSYRCIAGVWTIGYGHTGLDVVENMTITQEQADALLRKDIAKFENSVNSLVKVDINQNQFDALVSFTYNCGAGALKSSTLLKKINAKDFKQAALEFLKWDKCNGKSLAGLTRRRIAEKELFETGLLSSTQKLPYTVITDATLNIRDGAGVNFNISKIVPKGTRLTVWAIQTVNGQQWGKNGKDYFCLDYCSKI